MERGFQICLAVVALSSGVSSYGQADKTFEVVSIKRSRDGGDASETKTTPGRLTLTNATPLSLLWRAFGVQPSQVVDAPGWLSTERFDIIAVTGRNDSLTDEDRQPFLQSLLAERFGLKYHQETRDLAGYSLVTANSGSKLVESNVAEPYAMKVSSGPAGQVLRSTKGTIPRLVEILSRLTGRVVTDETGLLGRYDFTLEWVQDPAVDVPGPSLFTALQEQLGLRLVPGKRPAKVIVIDHIERPSPN